MKTWMNTAMLDSVPWPHRLCIAVELDGNRFLHITEGGHIHIQEGGVLGYNWKEIESDEQSG